jgi:predicted dinucleotide-binding enzyme
MSTIAIVGAGTVGSTLARRIVDTGHDVVIAATSQEHALAAATSSGARAAASPTEAVTGADLVILAVPGSALDEIAADLGPALACKVVVDVTNKPTPDLADLSAPATSAAEQLAALLPDTHVVKAFNTAFASRMAEPTVDGIAVDGFVAGDDPDAKARVLELVGELGFRPVDAGPLPMARALEAIAWLNIYLNLSQGGSWQGGWKLVEPTLVAA